MNGPRLSVLCPCRNEVDAIASCVRSILQQDPVEGGFELLVIDGLSDDGTWELLLTLAQQEPRLRLLRNPQQTVAAGLNAGLAVCAGSIIARVDAHTTYASDYLRACVAVLAETGAQNVGGAARTRPVGGLQRAIAAAYHSPFSTGGARFHRSSYEGWVDTVTYGCWPRRVFSEFGLFDEALVRNQDDEHNLRIVRGGGRIWQSPRIVSWYRPRASLRQLFAQYMQYGYWKVRVIQKHRMPAAWRHLVPAICLLAGLGLAVASVVWLPARLALAGCLALYSLMLAAASLHAWRAAGWPERLALPAVFATYHLAYAVGFVRGLVDFALLRRSPSPTFTRLTRAKGL